MFDLPVQLNPSPVNPVLQLQVKLPSVLLHSATSSLSHRSTFSSHSSISAEWRETERERERCLYKYSGTIKNVRNFTLTVASSIAKHYNAWGIQSGCIKQVRAIYKLYLRKFSHHQSSHCDRCRRNSLLYWCSWHSYDSYDPPLHTHSHLERTQTAKMIK